MILPLTAVQCDRRTVRNQQNHISKLCRDERNRKNNTVNILQNLMVLLYGLSVPLKYILAESCKAVFTFKVVIHVNSLTRICTVKGSSQRSDKNLD